MKVEATARIKSIGIHYHDDSSIAEIEAIVSYNICGGAPARYGFSPPFDRQTGIRKIVFDEICHHVNDVARRLSEKRGNRFV